MKNLLQSCLVLILMAAMFLTASCSVPASQPKDHDQFASISLGDYPGGTWQTVIGKNQQLFVKHGLALEQVDFSSGPDMVKALLGRQVDVIVVGEYLVVDSAFANNDISILGSFMRTLSFQLVVRKDKNISSIRDLKGKRVGVLKRSQGEFFLDRFLQANRISPNEIIRVESGPAQAAAAIANLDAVVTFPEYASQIETQLAGQVEVIPIHSSQPIFNVLVARNEWIIQNQDLVKRLLMVFQDANDYMVSHPGEAKQTIALAKNHPNIEATWPTYQFGLALDQSMVAAMTDEAHWMIANGLTAAMKTPDFYDYIYLDGLRSINPGAVTVSAKE